MLFDSPPVNDLFCFLLAFGITCAAVPSLIVLSRKKQLFDEPNGLRKLHRQKAPGPGGIALFFAFTFTLLLVNTGAVLPSWYLVFSAQFVLVVTGLYDDLLGLSRLKKFTARLLAAFLAVGPANLRITGLHGLLGLQELPYGVSLALSLAVYLFLTQAFTRANGVDGLAGGIGLVVCSVFGGCFAWMGDAGPACISFALAGGLLAFLIFNRSPARIFLGDTGSLFLGFTVALLAIRFLSLPVDSLHAIGLPRAFPAALVLSLLLSATGLALAAARLKRRRVFDREALPASGKMHPEVLPQTMPADTAVPAETPVFSRSSKAGKKQLTLVK